MLSPLISELIETLCCLPGVGPRTAQRLAFHLLERNREGGQRLAKTLIKAIDQVGNCQRCRLLSELEICALCAAPKRDDSILCVVNAPMDVLAIEQSGAFRGRYFVLSGVLSPIDGRGPEAIGCHLLNARLIQGGISEIIVATSPTVEGEATAYYIAQMALPLRIKVSRIAHGVPVGGELGSVDGNTLAKAMLGRLLLDDA